MWRSCMNPRKVIGPVCGVRGGRHVRSVVYVALVLCGVGVLSAAGVVAVITTLITSAITDPYQIHAYPTYQPHQVNAKLTEVNFSSSQTAITGRPVDTSLGQMDVSRTFKTHMFQVVGEQWRQVSAKWQVCMCTQVSADQLFWVAHQTQTWTGPLSVTVLAPDYDYSVAAAMIAFMQRCVVGVQQRTAFHLTYPTTLPPLLDDETKHLAETFTCDHDPEDVNKQLVHKLRPTALAEALRKAAYPQNLLRNIARKGCSSDYVITPDADMILVEGMADQLNHFVGRNDTRKCTMCAYLIPTYEIHESVSHNPTDKEQLLLLRKKGLARAYHSTVYAPNQGNSLLPLWEGIDDQGKELDVVYPVTSWRSMWEPMYVAPAYTPPFDERFRGYGYTRSSQVLEMHRAGFRWYMLNNAFLCHRGFQTHQWGPARSKQVFRNDVLYQNFRMEIWLRYSTSVFALQTIGIIFIACQFLFLLFLCKNRHKLTIEGYKPVPTVE